MTLLEAFFEKAHVSNFRKSYKDFIFSDLTISRVLELLVLKNDADCTCQRVKRPSGARVSSLAVRSGGLGSEAPQGGGASPPMTRRQASMIIIRECPLGQLESYHSFQNRDHHYYYYS